MARAGKIHAVQALAAAMVQITHVLSGGGVCSINTKPCTAPAWHSHAPHSSTAAAAARRQHALQAALPPPPPLTRECRAAPLPPPSGPSPSSRAVA